MRSRRTPSWLTMSSCANWRCRPRGSRSLRSRAASSCGASCRDESAADRKDNDMKRYAISSLAVGLTLGVFGGCSSAPQARLDPDVETVLPAPSVVYTSPSSTVVATPPSAIAVATPTTTITAPSTTVVQASQPTSVITQPDPTLVPAPGTTTVVPAPGTTTVVPSPNVTTVVPAPSTVVTTPPTPVAPQMLRADEIQTQRVRANTIYANKIEAGEVRGIIHQDRGLKVGDTQGEIKAPEVVAQVIYADQIKADSVIADHIFVRNLRRR